MSVVRPIAILALVFLLPAAALAGDDGFGRRGFYLGVGGSYGVNFFEEEIEDQLAKQGVHISLKDTWGVNGRVGYRFASWFALEGLYEYMHNFETEIDSIDIGGPVIPFGQLCFRGFIDAQNGPVEDAPVELGYGIAGGPGLHLHKAVTLESAGRFTEGELDGLDRTIGGKKGFCTFRTGIVREISNKNGGHDAFFMGGVRRLPTIICGLG